MSAGNEGEQLVAVVRELSKELGYPENSEGLSESWINSGLDELWGEPRDGESDLVPRLRAELARLAWAALEGLSCEERQVRAALDGAEQVMRNELAFGRPGALATHLPAFAFVVLLPAVGSERAIELSKRIEDLLERM